MFETEVCTHPMQHILDGCIGPPQDDDHVCAHVAGQNPNDDLKPEAPADDGAPEDANEFITENVDILVSIHATVQLSHLIFDFYAGRIACECRSRDTPSSYTCRPGDAAR